MILKQSNAGKAKENSRIILKSRYSGNKEKHFIFPLEKKKDTDLFTAYNDQQHCIKKVAIFNTLSSWRK